MDLKNELLAVLDNPSRVWEAILNNLAEEPRVALMTFATCRTPIDIVDWQAALARVNVSSAAQFEAALRVLDDSFVTLNRSKIKGHYANFRNPSMDDFCAAHLDKNVGFALSVASKGPSLGQIQRLIELGSATTINRGNVRRKTHGQIHSALITDPNLLYKALLGHLPEPGVTNVDFRDVITQMVSLIVACGDNSKFDVSEIRSAIIPGLLRVDFGWYSTALFNLLDNSANASTLIWILGNHLETFYNNLVESATLLTHFDSLVNLDLALGLSGPDVVWRDNFISQTGDWLDGIDVDLNDAATDRSYYLHIAEHLNLEDQSREQDWDDLVIRAEEAAMSMEDDGSWEESPNGVDKDVEDTLQSMTAEFRTKQVVDAMFSGLIQRDPH
jgi:hypothetical protein